MCGKSRSLQPVWEFRLRICQRCKDTEFVNSFHYYQISTLKNTHRTESGYRLYLPKSSGRKLDYLPHNMAILKPRDRRTACTLKSEVDRILQTWQALSNEDDKRAFISESQAKVAEIRMVSSNPLPNIPNTYTTTIYSMHRNASNGSRSSNKNIIRRSESSDVMSKSIRNSLHLS